MAGEAKLKTRALSRGAAGGMASFESKGPDW